MESKSAALYFASKSDVYLPYYAVVDSMSS